MILSDKTIKRLCKGVQLRFSRDESRNVDAQTLRTLLTAMYPNGVVTRVNPGFGLFDKFELSPPAEQELWDAPDGTIYRFTSPHGNNPSSLHVVHQKPMIENFQDKSLRRIQHEGKPSFPILSSGVSSYGYDVTLTEDFQIFSNANGAVIDPKRFDKGCLIDAKLHRDEETGEAWVILPPNSYLLGATREVFNIPRDIMVVAVGKSTYARAGAIVNVTPIEAGFSGTVVIEISNATTLPMRIYANEGVSQFLFFQGDQPCEVSYADRDGKYQNQQGLVHSKV